MTERTAQPGPWSWRYEATGGAVLEDASLPRAVFPSQAEAEAWVGETWRELLDAGVDAVSLLHGDDVVYGPMSLHPAEG
ncbi:hypothetical protein [Aquipuribacter sp. SD81]|uniref:hypothetical protein n=1 Tax=Aquipuribacter sp. SD81 TaxID=3127703 RepID=UPI003015FD27